MDIHFPSVITLILLTRPQNKSSDAGNSDMPKQSYKMHTLSENVKVPDSIRTEKKKKQPHAEVAKIYSKTNLASVKLLTRKMKLMLILLSHL